MDNENYRTSGTESKKKITSFQDLDAWKKGHDLVISVYELTDRFPPRETFSLSDQMRRAAVSVTSNIAEGFGRFSAKEKVRFYNTAASSVYELQNQLVICRDVGYINDSEFSKMFERSILAHKIINGLIKGCRNKQQTQ